MKHTSKLSKAILAALAGLVVIAASKQTFAQEGLTLSPGDFIVTEFTADKLSKVTPAGVRTEIFTFAGGTFHAPVGVAIDSAGNFIITESYRHKLSKVTRAGLRTEIFTFPFDTLPVGVAIDSAGNFIVTEVTDSATDNDKLVKITPSGVRTEIFSFPAGDRRPVGVAIDSAGNFIVTEEAGKLWKVTPAGVGTEIFSFAGGTGPVGVAIDSAGNFIVVERDAGKLSKVTPAGLRTEIFTFAGGTFPASVAIVPSVAQAIQNLITTIGNMGLPAGVATSLTAPLSNINTNNKAAACGKLNAFINQVKAKAQSGQLTSSQASQLLQAANAIKASMGC